MTDTTRRAKKINVTEAARVPTRDRSHLRLLSSATTGADDLSVEEAAALAFDVLDDMASLVPMPQSIPVAIRRALTLRFAARFEHYEDLDRWLHTELACLDGRSPFETLVAGQGRRVLLALPPERSSSSDRTSKHLRLIQ